MFDIFTDLVKTIKPIVKDTYNLTIEPICNESKKFFDEIIEILKED